MSTNKNLFYSLYSKSNNVISAGYTCNSAIDESDTSFDITVNSTGKSAGSITDSNGNPLSSIDMSLIHSTGLTQYSTETRIIQPYSCCVLQGQEYGLARASYYYVIPKRIKDVERFEYYLDCDFDMVYDNFVPKKIHIHTTADGKTSFVKQINDKFKENNIEVAVSLQNLFDNFDKKTHQYLVYLSQKEGYFYYINNLKITIKFQSEDYPDSPFKNSISELKPYLISLIEKYHPLQKDNEGNIPEYNEHTYTIDCELFTWLMHNYIEAVEDIRSFAEMIKFIRLALETGDDEYIREANIAIQNTVYDHFNFDNYDIDNIEKIYDIIDEIKSKIAEMQEYYKNFYWLREDKHRRIPLMKYPNGAFRGIVLIPSWPTNTDDYEYASLWINHIKSRVTLYELTPDAQYLPKQVGVLSAATLVKEEKQFRNQNPEFNSVIADNNINILPDGIDERIPETEEQENIDDIDTNYLDPYRPDKEVQDDLLWMGNTYYSRKSDIIGLFRYMQYVNDNDLWNKVGDAYMIIGKDDDPQSQTLNLPTSLLVYNPNPEPIRIKFMVFS